MAANLYKIRDGKDAAGNFFRAVQKQKNQYQGFWIATPDGKLLSSHQDHSEKKWTEEVLAAIDEALAKAGPLSPRNPEPRDVLPDWGKRVQRDGSVTLAVWTRYFFQGKGIGNGATDSVTWSAKEWKEFAPPEPVKGATWHLPAKMASQFSCCLSTVSDKSMMPRPDEVTEVDISGSVSRTKDGIATLSYTGRIAALHTHTFNKKYVYESRAKLRGIGTYDVDKQEMISLMWIFEGGSWLTHEKGDNPLAAVVEWQRDPRVEKAAGAK